MQTIDASICKFGRSGKMKKSRGKKVDRKKFNRRILSSLKSTDKNVSFVG